MSNGFTELYTLSDGASNEIDRRGYKEMHDRLSNKINEAKAGEAFSAPIVAPTTTSTSFGLPTGSGGRIAPGSLDGQSLRDIGNTAAGVSGAGASTPISGPMAGEVIRPEQTSQSVAINPRERSRQMREMARENAKNYAEKYPYENTSPYRNPQGGSEFAPVAAPAEVTPKETNPAKPRIPADF